MIVYTPASQRKLALFSTPFQMALREDNRWVKMAELVPWDQLAQLFFTKLSADQGRPTVDLRIILGALLIAHLENLSDERTIEYIQENIYAQYFVGLPSFQAEPVFAPSLFVEIRKRLGSDGAAALNDRLLEEVTKLGLVKHRRKTDDGYNTLDESGSTDLNEGDNGNELAENESVVKTEQSPEEGAALANKDDRGERNRGQMAVDATVAPVHIAYPTDTALLADCRRHSERLLDLIYLAHPSLWPTKPRTYRREAEKKSTNFSKQRRKSKKDIRKAIKNELGYLRRNFRHISAMLDLLVAKQLKCPWSYAQRRTFWIIHEVYRQQREMHADRRRSVKDRIVSLHLHFIRPIKRGKGGAKNTEFGPKLNATITEGFAWCHRSDFDAFNEGEDLPAQVEGYKERFGYYPAVVLADDIYWTNANRKWCKERGIRMNAKPKGRKPKRSKYKREKQRKLHNKRQEIEGKFGEGKNRYGLDVIRTKLTATIEVNIHLIFTAMNLAKCVRLIESGILSLFGSSSHYGSLADKRGSLVDEFFFRSAFKRLL